MSEVQDDPARHDYTVDQWVDKFVQNAVSQANHTCLLYTSPSPRDS